MDKVLQLNNSRKIVLALTLVSPNNRLQAIRVISLPSPPCPTNPLSDHLSDNQLMSGLVMDLSVHLHLVHLQRRFGTPTRIQIRIRSHKDRGSNPNHSYSREQ
jgi:hypothetical protein